MALSDLKAAATAAYPLDEASGSAIDAVGALDLTERNTVGADTGLLYGNARDFEASETDGFSRADHADLSVGDIDFFVVAWIKPESGGTLRYIINKSNSATANNIAYGLSVTTSTNRARFVVGNSSTHTDFLATATVTVGSWNLIIAYHDSVNNVLGVSVNGGAFQTTACAHGSYDDAGSFVLGDLTTGGAFPFDGLMQDVVLGKGYIPTDDDASDLWNSGTGVAFADWDAGGSTFTATISATIGAATAALSASHTTPTYTASAAATVGAATAALSASHTPPTYTATIGATVGAATASASAQHTTPTYTATVAATVGAATAALSAQHTPPSYTATVAATVGAATAAVSATFAVDTFTASIAANVGAATASASATFAPGTKTATIAATVGAATAAITATFVGLRGGDALFVHSFTISIYRGPQQFDFAVRREQEWDATIVRQNEFDLYLED